MTKEWDYEEDFHKKHHKEGKKERKIFQAKDRSKYKKTDAEKHLNKTVSKENLLRGRVISVTGKGIEVWSKKTRFFCSIKGALKKEISRKKQIVATGDWVYMQPISSAEGQIIDVETRSSKLERIDISGRKKQLIAANVDTVFITGSVHLPPLKPPLIDRYVIAAKKGGMEPIVVINKIDLLENNSEEKQFFSEFLDAYSDLCILPVSCHTKQGIDELKRLMQTRTSVFSGQSGVGKSSLINTVLDLHLPVGSLEYKGRHTTTKASLIPIGDKGFCIDTPGIRRFGLWDLQKEDVFSRFSKIQQEAPFCKYANCKHIHEPGCAVKRKVEEGSIPYMLYDSYQKLLLEAEEPTSF